MKKRIYSVCIVAILCVFSLIISVSRVSATGSANIVEMYVEDDNIILYVKGIESEIESVGGYIASESVEDITYSNLSQADVPIRTLILIDTSLSVKEAEQEHFIKLLIKLIDKKTANESFAIASYGEKIDYKSDFNSDRWELIKSLSDIEYKKQKTYLIEILYDLINEFEGSEEDCFYRIIVFSDGADSNDTGVTINELFSLLQKSPYPIYAIGSEYNSNADKLKELFSVSRITNANYSSFTSDTNLEEVEKVIDVIENYTRIEITVPKDLQDGSIKNVRLEIGVLGNTYTLNSDVRMNMHIDKHEDESVIIDDVTEGVEDMEDAPDDTIEAAEDFTDVDNKKTNNSMFGVSKPEGFKDKLIARIKDMPRIMYVFIVLTAIIMILIIIILISSRKKKNMNNKIDNNNSMGIGPIMESDNRTEVLVNNNSTEQKKTGTQYLFAPEKKIRIKLKDKSNNKIYDKSLDDILTIGRNKDKNVIAIYNEPTVSGQHCKIYLEGAEVFIEDNNSSNHTFVNGNKIDKPTVLRTGDIITLGRVSLEVAIYYE